VFVRDFGREREEVESECFSVWEGERGRHIGGVESVCGREREQGIVRK
jgi:hypothetical protein